MVCRASVLLLVLVIIGQPRNQRKRLLAEDGRNAVAADSVALCSQLGLGPGRLDDIHVSGESVQATRLILGRLSDNIVEMPLSYCLERLRTLELSIITDGLRENRSSHGWRR